MSLRRSAMGMAGTVLTLALIVSGCTKSEMRSSMAPVGAGVLTGAQQVPPVNTQASGASTLTVVGDKTLVGRVETKNINATAAHVHQGGPGENGPPIITLVKQGDNAWTVPSNAVLTSAQFAAYKAGQLYVNVHSAAHPNGEIRVQLKP